jgi:ribonuclease D
MSELQVKTEDGDQSDVVQVQQMLREVQTQKEQIVKELSQVRQEQMLRGKLYANGVLDEEAAMLVVQSRLSQDDKAELDKVIEQVRREKPYLFEALTTPVAFSATRGTKARSAVGQEKIRTAAAKAIKTAGRTELMEYMKARRAR